MPQNLAEHVHAYARECARSAPLRELALKSLQIYREHFFDGEPGEEAADCLNQAFTTVWEREGADRRRKRTKDYYRKDIDGDTLVLAEINEDDC